MCDTTGGAGLTGDQSAHLTECATVLCTVSWLSCLLVHWLTMQSYKGVTNVCQSYSDSLL